jgi:hypothetical protein
MRLEQE